MDKSPLLLDGPGRIATQEAPDYRQMVERLYALSRGGTKFGLERIASVLSELGHPERAFPSVHVAGSNGKGSTSAFLASVLAQRHGSVGLFTSPHLMSLTERVQTVTREERTAISQEDLVDSVRAVEAVRPGFGDLSFFEVITAAAFVHLSRIGIDVGVIEAGLGARLDATRLVPAQVAVLTDLSLEHTAILGDTLADIAREEGAVVRRGRPLVMADGPAEAMAVVDDLALAAGAPVHRLGRDFHILDRRDGRVRMRSSGGQTVEFSPHLRGPHQARNAALAMQAALLMVPDMELSEMEVGLAEASWPGRLEEVRGPGRTKVILDGAQNPHAAHALAASLAENHEPRSLHVLFGALRDKNAAQMIEALKPFAASWTLTRPASVRARDPLELAALLQKSHAEYVDVEPRIDEALRRTVERSRADGRATLVCGSLYLVGDARALLLKRP